MSQISPIAHAAKDANDQWRDPHALDDHLRDVANLSATMAQAFHSQEWAKLAGLWHDLGKYRPRFQHYIRKVSGFEADAHIKGESGKAPHSTAGALLAEDFALCVRRLFSCLIDANLWDRKAGDSHS
jgi:CRISPR-associated endonuclease/helicase Cas3